MSIGAHRRLAAGSLGRAPGTVVLASVAVLVAVPALAACSSDDGTDEATAPSFTAAFDCDGLADRWIRLQQSFLDRLGDASTAELDAGSDRVRSANSWLGGALIEQARDIRAVGCEVELRAGAPALCSRLGALEPQGDAGAGVVAALEFECASGE